MRDLVCDRLMVSKEVADQTLAERADQGKRARASVPRSVHGGWVPSPDRADPVDLLQEQAAMRVPELVPIRYGRMLVSPFTFYRGAAYLMASDLAGTPRTSMSVQLCGDAHLSNFGVFAAPDRRLVFSINDFDETLPGPFEWDVKRLVTSFAVAGRDRGFDAEERESVNLAVALAYRRSMADFAGMRTMEVWTSRLDTDEIERRWVSQMDKQAQKRYARNVAKARSKDSVRAFKKLVTVVDGEPRLIGDPPLIVPLEDLLPDLEYHQVADAFSALLRSYQRSLQGDHRRLLDRYSFLGAARKVVGVGQRRYSRLGRADARQRHRRPAVPAGQGSPALRAGALPGEEQVRQPRPAGGRGTAADAGGQ